VFVKSGEEGRVGGDKREYNCDLALKLVESVRHQIRRVVEVSVTLFEKQLPVLKCYKVTLMVLYSNA
jgi:hypothetical protein